MLNSWIALPMKNTKLNVKRIRMFLQFMTAELMVFVLVYYFV